MATVAPRALTVFALAALPMTVNPLSAADKAPESAGVITLTRQPDLGPAHIVQGPDGELWMHAEGAGVLHWTGKAWEKTPVQLPPHPAWGARFGPPWMAWSHQPLGFLPGDHGTLLAVVIRDVYQDIAKQAGDDSHRIGALAAKRAEELKLDKDYWLEGWLHADGKWAGPVPLDRLLLKERKLLLKEFAAPLPAGGFCHLAVDGDRLWAAFDGAVHLVQADGTTDTWKAPAAEKARPLPPVGLVRVADNKVWLVRPAKDGYELTALAAKDGRIKTGPGPALPERPHAYDYHPPQFHVSRAGDVWCWFANRTRGNLDFVYHYRGGTWQPRPDLQRFCLEDAGGALWFVPGKGHEEWSKDPGYRVVQGDQTTTFSLPKGWTAGLVTRLGKEKLLATVLDRTTGKTRVAFLVPAGKDDPARWRIGDVYELAPMNIVVTTYADKFGGVVEETGWAGTIPGRAKE